MENNKNFNNTVENQRIKFSETEKRKLISAVRGKQFIWGKLEKLHSNRNAMKAAWKEIAIAMGKPEEACRLNWKSVLDSKRYYKQRRKVPKKSGSACDLEIISDESNDPWEFSEDLEFLPETSELRTTSSSQLFCSPCFDSSQEVSCNATDAHTTGIIEPKKPAYSYKNTSASTKNVYLNEMRAGVSKVADVMAQLVDIAKTQKETNENNSFLNYVDSLLVKLPKTAAEDMQSNIIRMLLAEISKHRNTDQI